MTEKQEEELRIKTAVNLARIEFGRLMINDSRGDDKMVQDGKKHIHDGFDALLGMFGMGEPEPNFPFKRNERILYGHRLKDKDGYYTQKYEYEWLQGKIEAFGSLGYENRPEFIVIALDNGSSRHLDYDRAMRHIEIGKLKREEKKRNE